MAKKPTKGKYVISLKSGDVLNLKILQTALFAKGFVWEHSGAATEEDIFEPYIDMEDAEEIGISVNPDTMKIAHCRTSFYKACIKDISKFYSPEEWYKISNEI